MPSAGLLCLLIAFTAALAWGLYWHARLRKEQRRMDELGRQVRKLSLGGRLELAGDGPRIAALKRSLNQLIRRAAAAEREAADLAPRLFADLGERVHEAVLVHREVILYANRQFASLVGIAREELVGRRLAELVPPEYVELVTENLRRSLGGEAAAQRYELELIGGQGQPTRLEVTSKLISYEADSALLITGVEVIPTQSLPALNPPGGPPPSPQQLTLDALTEAVIATDVAGLITYANPAAEQLIGSAAEQLRGRTLENVLRLVDEADQRLLLDPVRQSLARGAPVNLAPRALLLLRSDGSERSIELSVAPIRQDDTELAGAVVLLHDVTEIRGLARQMSYQGTHDALTGLVNRRELERRLKEALDTGHRGDAHHLLCHIDLDHFRVVNDTSGSHLAGDAVLREIAKLLRESVRESDTVARLGGDEFALLLTGCPLERGRQILSDLCRKVSQHRFTWQERIFNIGISVGLVEISRESGTVEEALASADTACYIAKRQGSGQVVVYSARDEALARHSGEIQWLQRLQAALRENRLDLYQQPIATVSGEDAPGPAAEVLVRLKDDAGNEMPPGEILRAAERYKLMSRIDRWVVHTTLAALGRGKLAIPANRSVAINISGQTLEDAQFLGFVVECLDASGVVPAQVCFEISEGAVAAHLEQARRFVAVLHGLGCQFTLDDFGASSGALLSLKSLPLNYVKIDGSLMRSLGRDPVSQTLAASMIKLARSLNFKVIAEQVEDAAALEAARNLGVDFVQGYMIGRPQPLSLSTPAVPVT
jgi:diguanylate cyclase (GGDEF)-like protein/PAS domain S-box-containing protein